MQIILILLCACDFVEEIVLGKIRVRPAVSVVVFFHHSFLIYDFVNDMRREHGQVLTIAPDVDNNLFIVKFEKNI